MIVLTKEGHRYILNDVFEAIHVCLIHDNVPLEVVESVIIFFSIHMVVNYENKCVRMYGIGYVVVLGQLLPDSHLIGSSSFDFLFPGHLILVLVDCFRQNFCCSIDTSFDCLSR
jgi:hypothetical protein